LESQPALMFTLSDTSDLILNGSGDTTILIFKEDVITGIPASDYSLTLNLIGTSNSSAFSTAFNVGTITVGGQIFFGPAQVTPNQVIQGEQNLVAIMQVGNNGVPLSIDTLGTTLIFRDQLSNTLFVDSLRRTDTLTVLRSISDNELQFTFNVPADFELGDINVFGKISLDNNAIEKESLNPITSFTVNSGSNVIYVDNSVAPTQVVPSEDALFSMALIDSGTVDLALIPDSTYLEIGFTPSLRTNLGGNFILNANDTTLVSFAQIQMPASITSGLYDLRLHVVGRAFGRDTIRQDILLSDSLQVLSSGQLIVSSIQLSDTVVSQGESGETVSLRILNTGEAPARIFSGDSIQFIYNASYILSRSSGQVFPFTLNGGDSTLFVYDITVDPAAITGADTFRATVGYEDVNSGVSYVASDGGVYDSWQVLSGISLNIVSLNTVPTRVTQGQSGLAVSMEISNTGGTAAVIGSSDSIGISFLTNNNTVTLVSPVLPDTLAPSASRIYDFTVDINPSAATGLDSLRGFVIGRNVRTGAVNSVTSSYLDGWNVQTPANLVITRVFNALSQVNSGQEDLSVEVRLLNQGQATALLDTVGLYGLPGGSIIDTLQLASLPDSLMSGAVDTVLFNVDVAVGYTGVIDLDAYTGYRDGNDTVRVFADSGAVTTHTWTVGNEALLVIDSVFTGTETMSLGQSGVAVRAQVRNAGSASVQIDSLRMLYNGSDTHPVLSATRVLPGDLPLLSSGQSFIAEFDLSAASAPLDSGTIALDMAAYGTDQITSSAVDTLNSEQPDTLQLQTPAILQIVTILNPDSVIRGEQDIIDTLIIRNGGGATTRITSATLNFRNGTTFYSREVISPALPYDLAGNTTDTILVDVDVQPTAPLGVDSLAGQISGTELNRGVILNETSGYLSTWRVTGQSTVNILSVVADKNQISVGQDSISVQVRLINQGSTPARLDSLSLIFTNGASNYLVGSPTPALGFNLLPAAETTIGFLVDVNGAAVTGPDTIDARLVATDTLTLEQFIVDGAINKTSWLVQSRPLVQINSVTITPSIASTGQTGLTGRLIIENQAGAYRSSARVDSIDLNFLLDTTNVNTSFTILRQTPPLLPFTLPAGESQAINFNVDVDTTAQTDTIYTANGALTYTDINDDAPFVVDSAVTPGTLEIQSTTALNIISFTIVPDTVSQGQSNILATVVYENAGSASSQITSAQLTYTPPADFITALVNRNLPITLPGNTTDTLIYNITAAQSLTDTTFDVTSSISGVDLNSGSPISDIAQATLVSLTPPNLVYINGSIQPAVFELDSTITFSLDVTNNGGGFVDLDSNQTQLRILGTPYNNILLSGNSATRISSNDTVSLIFRATLISGIAPGDYAVQTDLIGTSTGRSFSQTLDAGQVTVGGDVFFAGGNVDPDIVLHGQGPVIVDMFVGNNGVELSIDSVGTTIILKQEGVDIIPQPTIIRTDTLDTLYQVVDNRLTFEFTVPQTFPLGEIEVWGQISLDGGSLIKESIAPIALFEVFSGTQLTYIPGSISETQVVPRQETAFSLSIADTGSSGLTLIPSLSYLEVGSIPVLQTNLAANYVVPAGDSSLISFNSLVFPDDIPFDTTYTFTARLTGVQVNGDTLIDTLTLELLQVLAPAYINIANVQIVPDVVRQNQSDIEVQYTLRNDGNSDANVRNLRRRFIRKTDSLDVSNNWVLSSILPEFPNTIIPGNSLLYTASYVLSAQADTGMIIPLPDVLYNDIRTADYVDTAITATDYDSVRVINPASLQMQRLVLTDSLAPNRPNVNINEPFILNLAIRNFGADSAKNVYVSLLQDDVPMDQYLIPAIAPYDSQAIDIVRTLTVAREQNYIFIARIDSAFDATTGDLVIVDQPLDNREDVRADTPVLLNIVSRIARPGGALDSVVSVGQEFEIDASISNNGTAPFDPGRLRLTVPANYTLITQSDSTYSENSPVISWRIRSNDFSVIPFDTITVSIIDTSLDRNTGKTAGLGSFEQFVLIRSDSAGGFDIQPYIASPAGAQDSVLSTGQTFRLSANITFTSSINDSGRVAQILMPGGYSVTDSTIKPLEDAVPNTTISWDVIARNDVVGKLDSIRVRVTGIDDNSGELVTGTSAPLSVQTVSRAEMNLTAAITAPAGATDGRVSVGQNFDLTTLITNRGTAGLMSVDQGQVSIELPASLILNSGNSVRPFNVDQPIIWSLNVANQQTPAQIVIRLDATPRDENSELAASTVIDSIIQMITIEQEGTIVIRDVTPQSNTVSSSQIFGVSTIYDLSPNVTNAIAQIDSLPQGFIASPAAQGFLSGDTINWTIQAPEDIIQSTDFILEFSAQGVDRNDSASVISGGDTTIDVTVVPRARVQLNAAIISPTSAITQSTISRGQAFEMRTWITRDFRDVLAMAGIIGDAQIATSFDSRFILENGDATRTFSWQDTISWQFRAPDTVLNANNFSFAITQAPLDENSNQQAFVSGENSTRSFALTVTQEQLVVVNVTDSVLADLNIDVRNFPEGAENVPVMIFTMEGPGSADSSILLKSDGLRLRFLEPVEDTNMDPATISNLIESIRISDMDYLRDSVNVQDFLKPTRSFINYTLSDTTDNPVEITWQPPFEFPADVIDTLVVMVNFRPGVENQSFRVALYDVYVYDVDPQLRLAAVDSLLNPLNRSTLMTSQKVSIIPPNAEDAFITYPNPFGKNQPYANIKFFLDDIANVEIRIFTLVGELVWTRIVNGEIPGVHDGAFESDKYRWDGTNDRGNTVLNGVYLCVLKTTTNAGVTNIFTKKVAYIK
jgi:hypothetical protein